MFPRRWILLRTIHQQFVFSIRLCRRRSSSVSLQILSPLLVFSVSPLLIFSVSPLLVRPSEDDSSLIYCLLWDVSVHSGILQVASVQRPQCPRSCDQHCPSLCSPTMTCLWRGGGGGEEGEEREKEKGGLRRLVFSLQSGRDDPPHRARHVGLLQDVTSSWHHHDIIFTPEICNNLHQHLQILSSLSSPSSGQVIWTVSWDLTTNNCNQIR